MQVLTVRLDMVFGQVKKACKDNGRIIDVGSDHGYLAVRCLEEGIVSCAVCTEIHVEPAKRSRTALVEAGFSDCSKVFVTDGLKGVPLMNGDVIAIAGMGGLNIIDILSAALKENGTDVMRNVTFILQPQKSNEIVRKFLAETGFLFEDEDVCCDRNIFYNCMRVVFTGETSVMTDEAACYGPVLLDRHAGGSKAVDEYFRHLDQIYDIRKRSNPTVRAALEERKQNERK